MRFAIRWRTSWLFVPAPTIVVIRSEGAGSPAAAKIDGSPVPVSRLAPPARMAAVASLQHRSQLGRTNRGGFPALREAAGQGLEP